ncbi:MAG: helix-turn-helix transcriptional regulator [Nitrospirae bacterium]|nr:helix-turn-helix transcriptional regulator [Nitrospirota bacterium]
MDVKRLIGLRIRELRRSNGISQERLAEKAGISSKYLSSIERGKENPTLDTFIRLSGALNIEISEVFNFSHEGRSAKDLKTLIAGLTKDSDKDRLKLTAKIIKAIYL